MASGSPLYQNLQELNLYDNYPDLSDEEENYDTGAAVLGTSSDERRIEPSLVNKVVSFTDGISSIQRAILASGMVCGATGGAKAIEKGILVEPIGPKVTDDDDDPVSRRIQENLGAGNTLEEELMQEVMKEKFETKRAMSMQKSIVEAAEDTLFLIRKLREP